MPSAWGTKEDRLTDLYPNALFWSLLCFNIVADLRSVPTSFVREDNCISLHCVRPNCFFCVVKHLTAQESCSHCREARQKWFLSTESLCLTVGRCREWQLYYFFLWNLFFNPRKCNQPPILNTLTTRMRNLMTHSKIIIWIHLWAVLIPEMSIIISGHDFWGIYPSPKWDRPLQPQTGLWDGRIS